MRGIKRRGSVAAKVASVLFSVVIAFGLTPAAGFADQAASSGGYSGGTGTAADPYQVSTQDDLANFARGDSGRGKYYQLMNDITLPDDWQGGPAYFAGTFDGGGHTVTVPAGGQALFRGISSGTVKNLAIYGEDITTCGLFSGAARMGSTSTIDSITVKSGSSIRHSGIIESTTSSAAQVNISNCTVERGVKVGWDASKNAPAAVTYHRDDGTDVSYLNNGVASIAGGLDGTITNCVSYADVYGNNYIGGILGGQGQSMSRDAVRNCEFHGTVNATGSWVGGIAAMGYSSVSAPNGTCVSIINCLVDGSVEGANHVGGIFGGEAGVEQCWSNGIGYITNNLFAGTVRATAEDGTAGAIIGYMRGINGYNVIENNLYVENCGATQGFGEVFHVDTTAVPFGMAPNGTIYFDSGSDDNGEIKLLVDGPDDPYTSVVVGMGGVRDDDPLSNDAVTRQVSAASLTDGTSAAALNDYAHSYKNWTSDESGTHHTSDPIASKLALSGTPRTSYTVGDTVDLSGITLTATYSDGTTAEVDPADCTVEYDFSKVGSATVALWYKGASASFSASVARAVPNDYNPDISGTVYLSISDDGKFVTSDGETAGETLAYVPVSLSDLAAVDPADFGLSGYDLPAADQNADYKYDMSVLQLLLYAQQTYSASGADGFAASGAPGSLYITSFMGHDSNFNYYVNGAYPEATPGLGATCDRIALSDGDYVDVAMFSSRDFYQDSAAGFHYFTDASGAVTHTYAAEAGKASTARLARIYQGTNGLVAEPNWTVWCGTKDQWDAYRASGDAAGSGATELTTGADGSLELPALDAGSYVLWTEGGTGADAAKGAAVSSPAYATLEVTAQSAVSRIGGNTADETAAAIAAEAFEGSTADTVVIARNDDYHDALAGSGLAGALNAPILLTDPQSLSQAAADEAKALGATKAVILGGKSAVSPQVASDLADLGLSVDRVAGDDVYGTSMAINERLVATGGADAANAVVVNPTTFADALSISGWAYRNHVPVMLQTWGDTAAERGFDDAAEAILAGRHLIVCGGKSAVSDESLEGFDFERVGGDTIYDTSRAIADWELSHGMSASDVTVASAIPDYQGVDALAASALAGRTGGVTLLAQSNEAFGWYDGGATAVSFVADHASDIQKVHVLGGEVASTPALYDAIRSALGEDPSAE